VAVDPEPVGLQAVPAQEPLGVEADAGGQAGREQLGRGRSGVLAAGGHRLVDLQPVAAHLDGEPVTRQVGDGDVHACPVSFSPR
jgi:hypothetical protein